VTTAYFTLVASLPALPDFERARRLPINRERLEQRLLMLTPRDRAEAQRAEEFLTWQRQPEHRADHEVVAAYDRVLEGARSRTLRDMVVGRLRRRLIQAELRRRHLGHSAPEPRETPGPRELRFHIRRNWTKPDFGLGSVHPWIAPMVELIRSGDSVALERLLMRNSWNALDVLMARERPRFSFAAVLVYLFQWDILSRWIAYDRERARASFDRLIEEAWHGLPN